MGTLELSRRMRLNGLRLPDRRSGADRDVRPTLVTMERWG